MNIKTWINILIIVQFFKFTRGKESKSTVISSAIGVYFDKIGILHLYPTQWKMVSYIDMSPAKLLWQTKDTKLK